ncbi:uncharacterized protein LOC135163958 [Diachasmimorpha longicaudata]|uniref:uncharacterized protein LOC135163958 n=1 Tax=Diachasmimorpha longicaudata TaxID=58733 RepID=UPI0030B8E11E
MLGYCLLILHLVSSILATPGAVLAEYQDSLGQYSFGYSSPESARSEVRSADGKTRGEFSFVDAAGIIQTAKYTADSENGFRIEATYLAEAPHDTPDVVAAREEHLKAIAEAKKITKIERSKDALKNNDGTVNKLEVSTNNHEKEQTLHMTLNEKKIMPVEEQKLTHQIDSNTKLPEKEHIERSKLHQQASGVLSLTVEKSNVNLQSQSEVQPTGFTPKTPLTTILQEIPPGNIFAEGKNTRGDADVATTFVGYSPYSSIYTEFLHPYAPYNVKPAITQFF